MELFDRLQETNDQWFDLAQSKANLASEFESKLMAARLSWKRSSLPGMKQRRFEMMVEDTKHFLPDIQKFLDMGCVRWPTAPLSRATVAVNT